MAELRPETRDAVRAGVIRSAAAVLPIVLRHVAPVGSILDVGCGEGHWLDAAEEQLGRLDCLGLDLSGGQSPLGSPIERWDAEKHRPLPTRGVSPLGWDVTLCLEMAEHVAPEAGDWLVRELCRVSRRVLWSAAIPGQGGDGHVNEQPPGYWAERFAAHDWRLCDPFRERLWGLGEVEPWYQQNLLLAEPALGDALPVPRHLVHPAVLAARVESAAYWREAYLEASALLAGGGA